MDVQQAALGTDDRAFQLRAERSGQSGERIYSVTDRAIVPAGNSRTVTSEVRVTH